MFKIKRNKWDDVFSKIIRTRDNWTCQKCGKVYLPPTKSLHCSHFVGRGHYTTRYDEDNCEALCVKCHQRLGANPNKHTDRKIMLIGYERYQELKRKQNLFIKKRDICTEEFYQEMKAKLKGLTDSFVYDGDEQC